MTCALFSLCGWRRASTLDDKLIALIKKQVRDGASPRHVPAVIIAVADIPRTKSGKITELAVREIVHGREVKNQEALANPEALDLFRNLAGSYLKLSRIAQIAREQDDRDKARRNNGERRGGAFFQLPKRSQQEYLGRQCLEIERPQDQRGRQLLHAIDKHQKRGRDQRRAQNGQMDFRNGAQRRAAQCARRKGEIGRHFLQAAFQRAEGDGQKADGIGKDDRGDRARQQKAGGNAKRAAHEGINRVVEIGERNEHADAQHRSRHGIADTGKPEECA